MVTLLILLLILTLLFIYSLPFINKDFIMSVPSPIFNMYILSFLLSLSKFTHTACPTVSPDISFPRHPHINDIFPVFYIYLINLLVSPPFQKLYTIPSFFYYIL